MSGIVEKIRGWIEDFVFIKWRWFIVYYYSRRR